MSGAASRSPDPVQLTDDAPHVLIVEDDRRIRDMLLRLLAHHGYRATTAANAAEARGCLKGFAFDLLLIDVMMPGEDGVKLARSIRQDSGIPILMLTARTEPDDRVRGLEAGADDYLGKPFEPRELLLRIASLLRRAARPAEPARNDAIRFGPYSFSIDRCELREDDALVHLTDREREMLKLLAENAGEIVPREALAGSGIAANERTVDVQVNRLRRKIERNPADPAHLQTVRGIGYRLQVDR